MELWQAILVALGGNATLLLVLGFLGRSLFGLVIAKDLEVFKARLAAKAVEHQITFAALHAKRAEVVAELYKLLVRAVQEASRYANPLEMSHDPDRRQRFVNAMNASTACFLFFDQKRLYLRASLCEQFEHFVRALRAPTASLGVHEHYEEGAGDVQHGLTKAWSAAWKSIEKDIPPLRRALESEFRAILGVENGPPS